ncbi:hypothetical protein HDU76_000736 [Blyttiomyces sp. JEL0837]|nr:hypothetical protein HDU76_000736 [Blyttiomyces sp. JEL0837]
MDDENVESVDLMEVDDEVDQIMDTDENEQQIKVKHESPHKVGGDDDDENADDDPIVREIPVFISTALEKNLFMFQYPTRKTHPEQPTAARVKPLGQRFELDVPIETTSDHYSRDKAESLSVGLTSDAIMTAYEVARERMAGGSSGQQRTVLLDKQTFQSSIVPQAGKYMVGVMRDEELHLTSLAGLVQLRPTLKYLDKIHEKEKAANQRIQQEEAMRESSGVKEEEEGKAIQLTARQSDDKEAMKRAKQGEEQKKYDQEDWAPLRIVGFNTPQSLDEYDKLFSVGDEVDLVSSKNVYLETISPKVYQADLLGAIENGKLKVRSGLPMGTISAMPLHMQLKAIMLNANLAPFSTIRQMVDLSFEDERIVAELVAVAVLVRGVWIARSELLYVGRIADARRILLHLYQKSERLTRHELNKIVMLPHGVVTNLFNEIATKDFDPPRGDTTRGWTLKFEPDDDFIQRFPDIVASQKQVVEEDAERARVALEPSGKGKQRAGDIKKEQSIVPTPTSSTLPKKSSSIAANGASSRAAGAPAGSSTSAAPAKDFYKEYKYSSTGSTLTSQCETLVRDILLVNGVASKAFIQSIVMSRKADEEVEDNLLSSEQVTPEFVNKIIEKLCVNLHDRWALKMLGTSEDEFRRPVLELFVKKESVKKSDVNAACQAAVGKNPPQNIYSKIMKKISSSSGPSWQLLPSPEQR